MVNTRYMVVTHPRANETLHVQDGKTHGRVAFHSLMTSYHWQRLDEDHVLLLGEFSIAMTQKIRRHSKVTMMPSVHSAKALSIHFDVEEGMEHYETLSKVLNLQSSHTMANFLDAIEHKMGPMLQPSK